MSEAKRLRINQIRRNVFVIERHNEGHWYLLNSKGEFYMKAPESIIKNGLPPIEDRGEYVTLAEAEEAMKDFLFYPRVVKESDSELKAVRVSRLEPLSKLKINRISHDAVEKIPKEVLDAVLYLQGCEKIEQFYADVYDLEKAMNEVASDLKWEPFKITIGRINENVNNPI